MSRLHCAGWGQAARHCLLQDVKSANVLLKNRDAKLADVGLSQILRNSLVKSLKGVGTFYWAALEVLAGTHPVCPAKCLHKMVIFAPMLHCIQPFMNHSCLQSVAW